MLNIIHALASYNRVKEQEAKIASHVSCHEARIALDPTTAQFMETFQMPDGRSLLDHVIEGRKLYEDLNRIGKT